MHRSRENIVNQFKENAVLMNQINYGNRQIRNSIYGIALMLSNMYFARDDPMRKEIQEDYMMKVDCVAEYGQEQYDAGKREGKIDHDSGTVWNIIAGVAIFAASAAVVMIGTLLIITALSFLAPSIPALAALTIGIIVTVVVYCALFITVKLLFQTIIPIQTKSMLMKS